MQQVERNLSPMLPRHSSEELKSTEAKTKTEAGGDDINKDLTIDVSLPQVIEEYVTEKLLVMSYIDGFKVSKLSISYPFLFSYYFILLVILFGIISSSLLLTMHFL